jgi:thiol-disulfide isomerase/thioredoxin
MEFEAINKKAIVAIGIVFLILLISFVAWWFYKSNQINSETRSVFAVEEGEAPYSDLYGKPVALEKYIGEPLVVVTWASWSPFSEADIKTLSALSKEYEYATFMAMNRKEPKEQAQRYVNTLSDIDGVLIVLDPRDEFYTAIDGYAMPEVVVYNKRGDIILHERGVTNVESIKTALDSLRD